MFYQRPIVADHQHAEIPFPHQAKHHVPDLGLGDGIEHRGYLVGDQVAGPWSEGPHQAFKAYADSRLPETKGQAMVR